jgi:endo-1,3-1,4-beta-glycanase ExoK
MTRSIMVMRAAAVVLLSGHGGLAAGAQGTSFFDGFDKLDPARWLVSDGWTNGDHQNCFWSGRAVTTGAGMVTLAFLPTDTPDRPFVCGEIQTHAVFGHGTFEARFRTDDASGINAAFFTYIGPVHEKPHDEIDFEVLTRDTSAVSLNTYVDGKPMHGKTAPLPAPADGAFHTYSFVWEPARLRWFIDGVLVHEATGDDLPSNPQKIYFSHWGSDTLTDWMGPFADPGRALKMDVDWVAYTAPGEGCSFDGSVLCTPAMRAETPPP